MHNMHQIFAKAAKIVLQKFLGKLFSDSLILSYTMTIIVTKNNISLFIIALLTTFSSTLNSFAYSVTARGTASISFEEISTMSSDSEMSFTEIVLDSVSDSDSDSNFDFDIIIYPSNSDAEFTISTVQYAYLSVDINDGNSKITLVDFICSDGEDKNKCEPDDGYVIVGNKTINVGAKAKILTKKHLMGTFQNPTYTMSIYYQ